MPDLACAAAAARTTPLAPIRPAISISTRVIRLLTTPILGSEVPGDFSRVNPLALLRPRRERPRRSRTADKRDELPSPHGAFPTAKDHGLSIAEYSRSGPCIAAKAACSCPLWVKSRQSVLLGLCPLYPQKRTWIGATGMSALCRFCCRSPLQAFLVGDSVAVMRFATGAGDDGAAESLPGAVFLFISSR